MMQHNKLEILRLTKRFGEKTLFEDLNLTVEEPAVLWAPSGWGKTPSCASSWGWKRLPPAVCRGWGG